MEADEATHSTEQEPSFFDQDLDPETEAAKEQVHEDITEQLIQDVLPGWKLVTFVSLSAGRDKKTGKKKLRKNKRRVRMIGVGQGRFKFMEEGGEDKIPGLDSLAEEILGTSLLQDKNPIELLLEKFKTLEELTKK